MKISLLSGAYQARSLIASAQRCVNLYGEVNQRESYMALPADAGAESPTTFYPTPGLTLLATAPTLGCRGLYRATNNQLFGVYGDTLYAISATFVFTALKVLGTTSGMTSMIDNGTTLVLVDGSTRGYLVALASNTFTGLNDPTGAFVGSTMVDYLDTFFVFNHLLTQSFYSSLSNSATFDPLYTANKTGSADRLVVAVVLARQIWLFGERTTEIWYNSGAANFPFQIVEGPFIAVGLIAPFSVQKIDGALFWLGIDDKGQAIVYQGSNYTASRISTHAIENELQTYAVINDAVSHIHQVGGHLFYVLTFPTEDKTWVFDPSSSQWHERTWTDANGIEHRVRPQTGTYYNGEYVCGDWQTGALYKYDITNYTDNGTPIQRTRGFPHVTQELKRITHQQITLDMQCGATTDPTQVPELWLRWSDDRGASWGNPVVQPMGQVGQTNMVPTFHRLGLARSRVYEVSWSSPVMTALNGAYLVATEALT